jgi:DNA polymerase II small subunit/DNA polymerase delta subunit B
MNHNHVKNLINLGYLVDESIANLIENIDEDNFYRLIEGIKKENGFIINNDLIKKILVREVNIIKEFVHVNRFTVQDFVKSLNERYSTLQNILIKRLEFSDLVSINKIGSGNASVIGLVKDKIEKEDNFIVNLEDPTGEIQTVIPKNIGEKLALDDVIAVSGRVNNKILFAEKLIYPDVPIRPVNYTLENIKIAFLEKGKDYDASYSFYIDAIKDKVKEKIYTIKSPCLVEIQGILILIISGLNPLDVLRRRYVNIENTDFIIDPVPDIIFSDKNINTNYKGITVISLNKMIDLKTREVSNIFPQDK